MGVSHTSRPPSSSNSSLRSSLSCRKFPRGRGRARQDEPYHPLADGSHRAGPGVTGNWCCCSRATSSTAWDSPEAPCCPPWPRCCPSRRAPCSWSGLGELITERGIGNGISLIIFAGIVAGFPALLTQGFLDRDNVLGIGFFCHHWRADHRLIVMFNEASSPDPGAVRRSIFRGGQNVPAERRDLSAVAHQLGWHDPADFRFLHRDSARHHRHLSVDQHYLGGRRSQFLRCAVGANVAAVLGHGVRCLW